MPHSSEPYIPLFNRISVERYDVTDADEPDGYVYDDLDGASTDPPRWESINVTHACVEKSYGFNYEEKSIDVEDVRYTVFPDGHFSPKVYEVTNLREPYSLTSLKKDLARILYYREDLNGLTASIAATKITDDKDPAYKPALKEALKHGFTSVEDFNNAKIVEAEAKMADRADVLAACIYEAIKGYLHIALRTELKNALMSETLLGYERAEGLAGAGEALTLFEELMYHAFITDSESAYVDRTGAFYGIFPEIRDVVAGVTADDGSTS